MEAREFLEKWKRICEAHDVYCTGCPLQDIPGSYYCLSQVRRIPFMDDKFFSIIENYHIRTRKDALLENYPTAILMDGGTPKACPKNLDSEYDCNKFSSCLKCREEYWNEQT